MNAISIVREAWASALSQRVTSVAAVIMIAGMCGTILLTTGRSEGAETAVLSSIDAAGTRSIVVQAEPNSGLDSTVLDRIEDIQEIEWAIALGPAVDVTNASIDGGAPTPLREAWSTNFDYVSISPRDDEREAWLSREAMKQGGFLLPVGAVEAASGLDYAVAGLTSVPQFMHFLEPVAVAPKSSSAVGAVAVLIVVTTDPAMVAPVAEIVRGLLSVADPRSVTITTSETLAEVRGLVANRLGAFGRNLVISISAVTAVLVSAVFFGMVVMRRKDFGRRRALGATRSFIVWLLLAQVMVLSGIGVAVGVLIAYFVLAIGGDPAPSAPFVAAVGIFTIGTAVGAAVAPAVVASSRDPVRELRVP